MKTLIHGTVLSSLLLAASAAVANDDFEGTARDAWITGKIETVFLLNRHLSNFAIDTDVESGTVRLSGKVESNIDRDLAGALAEGIDGVTSVDNALTVEGESSRIADTDQDSEGSDERDGNRSFGTWVDDATTTAAVKTKLLGNTETKGLEIDVDTDHDVVTLSGRVQDDQVRQLAEQIAMNAGDVARVRNNLVVDPE
jgi:osmotically-inducible protein OsmY